MSLFTALINLFVVAGVGWFTIYYLIPKIESGEIPLPGFSKGTEPSGSDAAGSGGGDVDLALGEIMDAVNGDESGTAEAQKKTTTSSTASKKKPSTLTALSSKEEMDAYKARRSGKSKTQYQIVRDYNGFY